MIKKIRTIELKKSPSLSVLFAYIKSEDRERSSMIVNNTRGMKTLVSEHLPRAADRTPAPVELTACHKNVAIK